VSAVATRTQLERAIDMLREGSKLAVTKLDRLVRSVSNMSDLLEQIKDALLSVI
jgi:DNA invertase Pin-like site-specific DNA recombinase